MKIKSNKHLFLLIVDDKLGLVVGWVFQPRFVVVVGRVSNNDESRCWLFEL